MIHRCIAAAFLLLATSTAQDRVNALRRAAALIDAQDLTGAEAILNPLLPDDALALNLLGAVRMKQGRTPDAEALLRKAVERGPKLAGPHMNLGALYGVERPSDAIAEFAAALKLSPGNTAVQAALRDVAKKAALAAVRSGQKESAVSLMLEACAALPHDPELLYQFGLVAMDAELYADARNAEEEALRLRPEFPEAMYALARAWLSDGKGKQAEDWFRKYLAIRPKDATAQYGLGYLLISEEKLDEARAAFERSIELQPHQSESLFQLGLIALKQGRGEAAANYFGMVLSRDPQHAGALTELAAVAFHERRYGDAERQLQRAILSSPSYQKAHYYLGLTLGKLGRREESDREFSIATELKRSPVREHLAQ